MRELHEVSVKFMAHGKVDAAVNVWGRRVVSTMCVSFCRVDRKRKHPK